MKPYEKRKYKESQKVTDARKALEEKKNQQIGDYVNPWEKPMGDLMGQIQNRQPFHYDPGTDTLYRQAVDRYVKNGRLAMEDTLGMAAGLTGGYGSSYAQSAAQQQYGRYLQDLHRQMPRYYQMALDRYTRQGAELERKLGLYREREKDHYGRYQDRLDRHRREVAELEDSFRDQRDYEEGKFRQDQEFDYRSYQDQLDREYRAQRDRIRDDQWLRQLERQKQEDKARYDRWKAEFDENQRRYEEKKAAEAAKTRGRGGSGGRKNDNRDGESTVEERYLFAKRMGAPTLSLDSLLRYEIVRGNITPREATELRERRDLRPRGK